MLPMIPNNALREVCCLNTNTALSDYDLYTYKLVDMRKKIFLVLYRANRVWGKGE